MKIIFTMKSKFLNSIVCFVVIILMNGTVLNAQSFKFFGVSDLRLVFEDDYNLPPFSDAIKRFGIRGEIRSSKCAFRAMIKLTNFIV